MYPIPPQTNSSSNSALSHYSAATSIGLTKRVTVNSRHSFNSSKLLPKLSNSSSSLSNNPYASFPSMSIQKAFSNMSDESLPSLIQSSTSPVKFYASNTKVLQLSRK
jgi:hypothetical protein